MTNQERKIIEQIKQNDLSASYDLLTVNHSFLSSLYHKLHIAGYYYEEFLSMQDVKSSEKASDVIIEGVVQEEPSNKGNKMDVF